jgi:hypothetical protein
LESTREFDDVVEGEVERAQVGQLDAVFDVDKVVRATASINRTNKTKTK